MIYTISPAAMSPESLNIIIALTCMAYMLVYDHLGLWRGWLCMAVTTLAAATAGILWWCGGSASAEPALVALVLVSGHALWVLGKCVMAEGRSRARGRKRANLPPRRHKKVTSPYPLSNDELISNFRSLAEKDDLTVVRPNFNFLAWNNRQNYVMQLFLLPDGGWVSIFWSPTEFELRDREIMAACRAANVPCNRKLLGTRAQGIAICRNGQLTITPADQQIHFDEFLHGPLAPQPEFTDWLSQLPCYKQKKNTKHYPEIP